MRTLFVLIATSLPTAVCNAQTVLLPAGLTTTEGNRSTTAPFGRGNQGARVQYIYDSAALVAAGLTAPIYLRTLAWRADGGMSGQSGMFAAGSVTLKLGTCTTDHLAVSGTFDANFATAQSWQLGALAVSVPPGTTPNGYLVTVAVPGDFLYDPLAGQDLVIEMRIPTGSFTGQGGNNLRMDHDTHAAPGIGASSLISNNPNNTTVVPDLDSAGVIQLGFDPLPSATTQYYGTGCGATFASIYQRFLTPAAAATALSNTAFTMTRTATGYAVTNSSATVVPPTGNATTLVLGDDDETSVALSTPLPLTSGSTSTLWICSNGFVSTAQGNGTSFLHNVLSLLNAPHTAWRSWHDYDPSIPGSGPVQFEEASGIAYVTWNGVWEWGSTSNAGANTVQFQFDLATGNVTLVFGTLSALLDLHLVGYSLGGASTDPGSTDLATQLPRPVTAIDTQPLSLTPSRRPVLGSFMTYTVGNIPPNALLSAHMMSLGGVDPGIDLTGIGMPGCRQYIDLGIAATTLLFGSPTASRSFAVPTSPSFTGLSLDTQAASLVPGLNPLGASLSNAVLSTIGGL